MSGINLWHTSLGRVTSKSGKSSVLHARNRSFVRRGFRPKVPFFSFQARGCSGHCLWRSCARLQHTSTSIFSEILSAVCACVQLPGNRVFNQSHCLSKVCVLQPSTWKAVLAPRMTFVEVQESVQQHSMTYVWKCKRTCSSIAWRMCGNARERAAA